MNILDFDDTYVPPFKPRRFEQETKEDNYAALNNLGRKEVTEDFEDSPFADRI